MQWLMIAAGLLILGLLTFYSRRRSILKTEIPADLSSESFDVRIERAAQSADGNGYTHFVIRRSLLTNLERNIRWLHHLPSEVLLPAARQLCENGRFLQQEAADAILESRRLPKLPCSPQGKPRILTFVQEMLNHHSFSFSVQTLHNAARVWQNSLSFIHSELVVLPVVLKAEVLHSLLVLSERCVQDQKAYLAARQYAAFSRHKKENACLKLQQKFENCDAFWAALYGQESDVSLPKKDREAIVLREHAHQAEWSMLVENAIMSLHAIRKTGWHRLQEDLSLVHEAFQEDETYRAMDEESRAYYRQQLATIAKKVRLPERTVCVCILSICQGNSDHPIKSHVGYYLIDEGRSILLTQLQAWTLPIRLWMHIQNNACAIFRAFSWGMLLPMMYAAFRENLPMVLLLPYAMLFVFCFQRFALHVLQKTIHPRMLPRIHLTKLHNAVKTLVVCPVMLTSAQQAIATVKRMSVMHEANPDANLHFLLLGDFQDSLTGTAPEDAEILTAASTAVQMLCEDSRHPFFYMQRERVFSPGENTHHSRERKRGSLETLLRLIEGKSINDHFAYSSIDPAVLKGAYRYVITLDSDTFLPPGSVLRMVGTMLHPLQQRQQCDGKMRGVSIIQPRMETAAHLVTTPFGRLTGGNGGMDSYNSLLVQLDQDIFGRGTFMGKGIIDPAAFLSGTDGAIAKGSILSHDLLEGELSGCACASDIVLYDGHPQRMKGYWYREHRWIRGDWQLLPYVLPFFPRQHKPSRNPLDKISKWKIWRNLFKTLIPPLRLLLMIYAVFAGRGVLFAAALLLPDAVMLFPLSVQGLFSWVLKIAMLPCEAVVHADAIGRTLYRLFVSHQKLLSWTTAAQLEHAPSKQSMQFYYTSMTAAVVFALLSILENAFWPGGFPLALLWAVFPFVLPFLEQDYSAPLPTGYMREVLHRLAQNTLLYFETSVTEEDHFLPPDNLQIEPNKGFAHRTSPTNIGLYLCSLVAAERLGLLTAQETAQKLDRCLTSLEQLPNWHGLHFNWYNTQTLSVLSPNEISSVDCGNLAVCLMTCAQGIRVLFPQLEPSHRMLAQRMDTLVNSMDLSALYDQEAELFHVTYNPNTQQSSAAHYDLLASESRLLSFAAIAIGKVSMKHWHKLGRRQTPSHALISCNGTMFEYMMPLLFQPLVPKTLLEDGIRRAFKMQTRHRLNGAFGVSESGYHHFDPDLNYQYKAFGIPQLALNTDVQSNVLAPYATLLSMAVDLKRSFRNLLRLQVLGLEGSLGLFEAADFDAGRAEGKRMQVVRSHMAHHQGMILSSICNVLEDGYLQKLFISLPRVQAFRLLLEEKTGHSRMLIRRPLTQRPSVSASPKLMQRNASALTLPADAHILSGGGSSLVADAQGHGFLKHQNVMLTRFRGRPSMPDGIRIYLKDSQSGDFWLATDPYLCHNVRFESSQIVFDHERDGLRCELQIWINPLDGSFLHSVKIENNAKAERILELCSYLEPLLCDQQEVEHYLNQPLPCIQTERLGAHGLKAVRRSNADMNLWHFMKCSTSLNLFRVQCDRNAFVGRGRSFLSSRSMDMPISAIPDFTGNSLDPCMSLRGQFTLLPGQSAAFLFVTHLAHNGSDAVSFMEHYAQSDAARRTQDAAKTRSLVTAHHLNLSPAMQADVSRLVGPVCWSEHSPEPHVKDTLRRLSISWVDPIVLCTCMGTTNAPFLTLLLKAHALHRLDGLKWTLVFLLDNTANSASVLYEITALVHANVSQDLQNRPGGVYVLTHIAQKERDDLLSAARVVFSSSKGSISDQLDAQSASVRARPLYACKPSSQWKPELPATDLLFENGLGGFIPDSGDYQIHLAPGRQTPAPWLNLLGSSDFTTAAAESGLLFTCLNHRQQLSHWNGDMVSPKGSENFFIRDSEHRVVWSLTRLPLGQGLAVRVTHAPGETVYESSGYGIQSKLCCFTSLKYSAGLRIVTLKNTGEQSRTLTFCHTCIFPKKQALDCTDGAVYGAETFSGETTGLFALDPAQCQTASMPSDVFQGLWSSVPYALSTMEHWPQNSGNTALLSFRAALAPGESAVFASAIVHADSLDDANQQINQLKAEGPKNHLRQMRSEWENQIGRIHFALPDKALEMLMNRWLPVQVHLSVLGAESAVFHDAQNQNTPQQMMNVLPLLYTHPEKARACILSCATQIAINSAISQENLYLPFAAAVYAHMIQDLSIWQEDVAFGDDNSSAAAHTLLDLCVSIIDNTASGAHGFPLLRFSDAREEESTVYGMLLCESIRLLAPFCDEASCKHLNAKRCDLLELLDRYAWDGNWYVRGWTNGITPIGSASDSDCQIDLTTQVWSVLCGVMRERSQMAIDSVWNLLYEKDVGLLKNFAPPFEVSSLHDESISLPGTAMNGGQITVQACLAIAALHQLGKHELAWELIGALLPTNHTATGLLAARYRTEPYMLPGTISSLAPLKGMGSHSWSTASASCFWMVLTAEIFGLRITGNQLCFRPQLPASWEDMSITLHHGSSTYHLSASRSCLRASADGHTLEGGILTLKDDGKIHEAEFPAI